jgi:hypothetical protein
METTEITEIQKLLKSVGIETFINYYYEFEKTQSFTELSAIFDVKENWSINSKKTKASIGNRIFKKELNIIALQYIINVVQKRLSKETIERAKKILDNIKGKDFRNNEFKDVEDITEDDIYWGIKDFEEERKIITGR